MKPTKVGITFRETMSGGFALGETDPRAGHERGERDRATLTMHATIDIQDLDAFTADARHGGRITGTVSFPPLGDAIPAKTGVFQLFSPADDPKTKYMVYELGFASGGKDYYLAGKKEVRDDPGFDLWSDTTTLYTRLHQSRDATGPVVGAGILRLGIMDLRRLVSTMHAVGTESTVQAAEAVLKFGRFFVGELWSTYLSKAGSQDG